MASEQDQIVITLKAEADMSAYQYRGVSITNEKFGTLASSSQSVVLGIQMNKPQVYGAPLSVCVDGHTKAVAGAAGCVGNYVCVCYAGLFKPCNNGSAKIVGVALTAASGSGALFELAIERWIRYQT